MVCDTLPPCGRVFDFGKTADGLRLWDDRGM